MGRMNYKNPPRDLSPVLRSFDEPDPKTPNGKTVARWKDSERSRAAAWREYCFVVACARAFWRGELSDATPPVPGPLRIDVRAYGGNVSWLAALPSRKRLFESFKSELRPQIRKSTRRRED